jgi:N-methylhydantoinase A
MYTIDIDIGGTLTDGLFSDGERVWVAKVDTTPHDFTVCFLDCLQEGVVLTGHTDLTEFLEHVEVIRWSSTIATNVLAEGKGPRLGLLVSPGHEADLYGQGQSPALGRLISPANIVTVQDPTDQEEVLGAVRSLLEQGVRRICISLRGAFQDDSSEQAIKRLVEEQFPDHYLGAVPALLGSQIARHPDDMTRTHMALINAYVHTPLAMALFKAEDELLSQHNYRRPVYIGHVNGGVARVSKTKGVDTTESGPVFGLVAAAYFARRYQLDRVIALDVGGTTTKVSLIVAGEPVMVPQADFFGVPLDLPWTLLRSAALGGGSVARVSEGRVTLGPDSMGAYPGPACYDLGGDLATLTDAFVAAGMLNPARFLDGRRELNVEQAQQILDEHIAGPLAKTGVEEAARLVIDTAVASVTDTIRRVLDEAGYSGEGFHLFCFGGNGANFAAATANQLGLEDAYVFKFGPVLSAFGSSISDISHIHEEWPFLKLSGEVDSAVWELIEAGRQRVLRDLEGEGLSSADAVLSVELSVAGHDQRQNWILEPQPEKLREVLSGAHSANGGVVERVAVRGVLPVPCLELEAAPEQQYPAQPYDQRQVFGQQAGLYDWNDLTPGAVITGPAVLESATNTCTIPAGWALQLDGFDNAMVRQTKGGE